MFLLFTSINQIFYRVRSNQSLKLTEPAVDDFARAKQPATIGRDCHARTGCRADAISAVSLAPVR